MALKEINAEIALPFGLGKIGGRWEPEDVERAAAWELYIELVTRISVAELQPGDGLLREALASLYQLFGETRKILRSYGPAVARPRPGTSVSLGYLAVAILNGGLRPLLAQWHPRLLEYEQAKPADVAAVDWERRWGDADELRAALNETRRVLVVYAGILGDACDAKSVLNAVSYTPTTP